MTLHIVRHRDVLMIMTITHDPIDPEEPLALTGSWPPNPAGSVPATNPTCLSFTELPSLDDTPGTVAHFLPGTTCVAGAR